MCSNMFGKGEVSGDLRAGEVAGLDGRWVDQAELEMEIRTATPLLDTIITADGLLSSLTRSGC